MGNPAFNPVTRNDREAQRPPVRDDSLGGAMLTKDILFGMNLLTLAGLLMTGFGLTLRRSARAGLPFCVGFMGVGTVLVLVGLYASGWPR